MSPTAPRTLVDVLVGMVVLFLDTAVGVGALHGITGIVVFGVPI